MKPVKDVRLWVLAAVLLTLGFMQVRPGTIPGAGGIVRMPASAPATTGQTLTVTNTTTRQTSWVDNAVEKVADYTALDASTGTTVQVTDADVGGLFVKSADQASAAKPGLRIRRDDLTYVDRVWDEANYQLKWADVDAYNDPADAIEAVLQMLDGSATLHGDSTVYECRREIRTTNKKVSINNLRLKRADAEQTTITAEAAAGATSFSVVSTTGFVVGDEVMVADVSGADAGQDHINGSTTATITAINGLTITTSGGLNRQTGSAAWPSGSKLFRVNSLLVCNDSTELLITNCTFDGNYAGNDHNLGWEHNVSLTADGDRVLIQACTFINSPCETMFLHGNCTVKACVGKTLYGSFTHTSDPVSVNPALLHLVGCSLYDVCKGGTLGGHNEGAFCWSSNVSETIISDCFVDTCGNACFGDFGGDDAQCFVVNSMFRNTQSICKFHHAAGIGTTRFAMRGCTFEDCGDMYITGLNTARGHTFRSGHIENCRFIGNSRIWGTEISDWTFRNLDLVYSDSPTFASIPINVGPDSIFVVSGAMSFYDADRCTFDNIRIDLPKTYTADLEYGFLVQLPVDGSRKREISNVATDRFHSHQMRYVNISVSNARFGIMLGSRATTQTWFDNSESWYADNLIVWGPPDTNHTPDNTIGCGVLLAPGMVARNVTVHNQEGSETNDDYWPIIASGIHSTGPVTQLRGAILDGFLVTGKCFNAIGIGSSVAGRSKSNVVAVRGLIPAEESGPTLWRRWNVDALVNHVDIQDIGVGVLPSLTDELPQHAWRQFEASGDY